MSEPDLPTTVSFLITPGDVWIDRDDIAWRVVSIHGLDATLERIETRTIPNHDLVLGYRRPNEKHPRDPE
jgi:hypothetical protein